jgi:hypothetical protein
MLDDVLYAPVNANAWQFGWEEIEYLEKRLRTVNSNYQVGAERRMMGSRIDLPEYRFVLLKWNVHPKNFALHKREVLLETHDINHMASVLKILISVEKESADAYKY